MNPTVIFENMSQVLAEDVGAPELRNPLLWRKPRNGWLSSLAARIKRSGKNL